MSSLSTHVLDTVSGRPAVGVALRLFQDETLLFSGTTDDDGRCPDLCGICLSKGCYRLEFEVGSHFRQAGQILPDPPFLEIVPILFGLEENTHVHVPLLAAPYGYSTYRGS